jgi:hypothetical protein
MERARARTLAAVCQCGTEDYYERAVDDRVRLDPLDTKTSRHAGQCEFASETDAAVLRVILEVRDGMAPGYWWVRCHSCESGWQVPHYAEQDPRRARRAARARGAAVR